MTRPEKLVQSDWWVLGVGCLPHYNGYDGREFKGLPVAFLALVGFVEGFVEGFVGVCAMIVYRLGCLLGWLMLTTTCFGFGLTGHRIVGEIAAGHITQSTQVKIKVLLAGASLAEVSTWADEIRIDPSWDKARPWHYINVAQDETIAKARARQKEQVLWAIEHFSAQLVDPKQNLEQRRQALKFLVHFVGDLHLPVHVGLPEDKGASRFDVRFLGRKTNLHAVWDSAIIDSQQLSFSEWVTFLKTTHNTSQYAKWRASTPMDWAQESLDYRPNIYQFKDKKKPYDLGYPYVYQHLPFLKQRLVQAGVRLAALLDELLAKTIPLNQ